MLLLGMFVLTVTDIWAQRKWENFWMLPKLSKSEGRYCKIDCSNNSLFYQLNEQVLYFNTFITFLNVLK